MFIHEIWGKFTSLIFWNFPLKRVITNTKTSFPLLGDTNQLSIDKSLWYFCYLYIPNLKNQTILPIFGNRSYMGKGTFAEDTRPDINIFLTP